MRRRGMTLIELMVGVSLMAMVLLSSLSVLIASLRSFERTDTDVTLSEKNAAGMRRIAESIRSASGITLKNNGTSIVYTLPARADSIDPITGEKEIRSPIVSDGVQREFKVQNGNLIDVTNNNRVLVKDVSAVDPDPASSQYNQTYSPFTMTTIGSRRAVTINLITMRTVNGMKRMKRLKTTVLIQNSR